MWDIYFQDPYNVTRNMINIFLVDVGCRPAAWLDEDASQLELQMINDLNMHHLKIRDTLLISKEEFIEPKDHDEFGRMLGYECIGFSRISNKSEKRMNIRYNCYFPLEKDKELRFNIFSYLCLENQYLEDPERFEDFVLCANQAFDVYNINAYAVLENFWMPRL